MPEYQRLASTAYYGAPEAPPLRVSVPMFILTRYGTYIHVFIMYLGSTLLISCARVARHHKTAPVDKFQFHYFDNGLLPDRHYRAISGIAVRATNTGPQIAHLGTQAALVRRGSRRGMPLPPPESFGSQPRTREGTDLRLPPIGDVRQNQLGPWAEIIYQPPPSPYTIRLHIHDTH
jgi:hypothetical protein